MIKVDDYNFDPQKILNEYKPQHQEAIHVIEGVRFFDWRQTLPKTETWVWSNNGTDKYDTLVLTCKRKCCVYSLGMTLMPPKYWRPATEEEIGRMLPLLEKITPIDTSELYI